MTDRQEMEAYEFEEMKEFAFAIKIIKKELSDLFDEYGADAIREIKEYMELIE